MAELLIEDLHYAVRFLPRELRKLMADYRLMVAGGFLCSNVAKEEVQDIDLFGPTKEILHDAAERLAAKWGVKVVETRNAITVAAKGRKPVQFITRWLFTCPEEVIKSFDFTVAQAMAWPETTKGEGDPFNWRSLCSDRFYSDLAAKRLTYTGPARNEDAGGSMLRVTKFLRRGYTISPASLGAVMARMANRVNWSHPMVADETGIAKVFTGLLRQVDPLLAIDGIAMDTEEDARFKEIKEALRPSAFRDDSIPDVEQSS